MNKAVFLDRDGVINVDHAYVYKPCDFEFIDGVFETCRYFQQQGYLLIVVSNQSGIGRGYYTDQDFQKLTDWMRRQFHANEVTIHEVYYCPHHPQKALPPYNIDCNCRKPAPGMIEQAIHEHQIDPASSIMFGDKATDMKAAMAAGVGRKILVESGQPVTEDERKLADEVWPSIKLC